MKYTDHDGKSRTASAAARGRYPEQHLAPRQGFEIQPSPTHDDIAARAYALWNERGRPIGSPDQDWIQAEQELQAAETSHDVVASTARLSGSVQH